MNAKEITEIIAREKNMTPEAVEYEMRSAIREAMASEKPDAKAMWKQIAPGGKEPSINRFLQFCVNILNGGRKNSLIDKLTSILSVWMTGFVCICAMRR